MSGSLPSQPIYRREDLLRIEEELNKAGSHIEYKSRHGVLFKRLNPLPGVGYIEVPPHHTATRNFITTGGEKELNHAAFESRAEWFTPLDVVPMQIHGPNLTAEEAIRYMDAEISKWESSAMCASFFEGIKQVLPRNAKKIVAFGLGPIGILHYDSDIRIQDIQSFREHAYVLTVARALSQRNGFRVPIYVQDPSYTSVCKQVLPARYGIEVIGGWGARGFLLVDDETVVMNHHANYAMREIIASIARPAAMCWAPNRRRQLFEGTPTQRAYARDVDSTFIDRMLEVYDLVAIPGLRPKVAYPDASYFRTDWMIEPFYDSVWYVRRQRRHTG
ncbi:hypothetical protein F5Y11DRAFT_365367 [Daldinia sp. FL1419]|nr:hypothetical protein F5Y11DRAFT_365367 [Daldinia sp. FL1419]